MTKARESRKTAAKTTGLLREVREESCKDKQLIMYEKDESTLWKKI